MARLRWFNYRTRRGQRLGITRSTERVALCLCFGASVENSPLIAEPCRGDGWAISADERRTGLAKADVGIGGNWTHLNSPTDLVKGDSRGIACARAVVVANPVTCGGRTLPSRFA